MIERTFGGDHLKCDEPGSRGSEIGTKGQTLHSQTGL